MWRSADVCRTKAAVYIEAEKVYVNGQIVSNVSRTVKDGEVLSIRGIGKFKFDGAGGQSKKGRTVVRVLKYK